VDYYIEVMERARRADLSRTADERHASRALTFRKPLTIRLLRCRFPRFRS